MSGKRRAAGPKRQLSLQQSTRRPGLRKQASEDSSRTKLQDRNFVWDPHNDSALRVLANSISGPGSPVPQENKPSASKRRDVSYSAVRPRPVKIAWTDRRQQSQDAENSVAVEVVAQRCKGQPRPVTAKPPSRSNLLVVQPNTILYSKDQLAERLRLAWKEREESRPNLDIFLTHGSFRNIVVDEDCPSTSRGNRPATRNSEKEELVSFSISQSQSDNYSSLSDKFSQPTTRKLSEFFDFRPVETDHKLTNVSHNYDNSSSELGKGGKVAVVSGEGDYKKEDIKQTIGVKCSTAIKISLTSNEQIEPDVETTCNVHEEHSEPDYVKCFDSENKDPQNLLVDDTRHEYTECSSTELSKFGDSTECESDLKEEKLSSEKLPEKVEPLTASARRVNFRNSGKSPVVPMSLSISSTPPASPRPQSSNKIMSSRKTNPFLPRMMSAPAQGRSSGVKSPSQQNDNTMKNSKDQNITKSAEILLESTSRDNVDEGSRRDRLIKSAPPKRKLKGGRRKGLRGFEEEDEDSSEEETNREEKPRPRRSTARNSFAKVAEIVTMVSLLSPNQSDLEEEESAEPVIQLSSEPGAWTLDNKEEAGQPPKVNNETTTPQATISTANLVSLRKLPKIVSFQQSSAALNRSYTASYPSRRGTVLSILASSDQPAPPILAAPSVAARKKLIKAKSIGPLLSNEENNEESAVVPEVEKQAISVEVKPAQTNATDSSVPSSQEKSLDSTDKAAKNKELENPQEADVTDAQTEPEFKTAKEKECWMLFRHMADKGVAVSFDTVLRGMLTPTEYRLHKKALSSTC